MTDTILYIHYGRYDPNNRGINTTIERLSKKGELTILTRGVTRGEEFRHITFCPLIFSPFYKIVRFFFEREESPWPFMMILFMVLKNRPKIVYYREPKYIKIIPLIKMLSKNIGIHVDIRENPAMHFKRNVGTLQKISKYINQYYAVSSEIKTLLQKQYRAVNVDVLYSLPSSEFLSNRKTFSPRKKGLVRFCFFGYIKENREIHLFSDRLNQLAADYATCFHLYGPVKHRAYLKRILSECPIAEYRGVIPYKSAAEILSNYDIGVLTNEVNDNSKYTIPGKFWEYLSCGMAIISNERPSIVPFIESHDIGWVARCPEDWDNSILKALTDVEELTKKKRNSIRFFKKVCKEQRKIFV
ncbi:MAG: glycosyltransferase [Desulfobacterales bacterium]|nr:glycosyltransferase [Desulfobacterales bacterium]